MEQKKSTLKEIKATVMPQTAEGLQMLMEETGLTVGEVIDRLTLQMCPDDLGFAVCFAQDQIFFSISIIPSNCAFLGWLADEDPFVIGNGYNLCFFLTPEGKVIASYRAPC